MVEDKAKPTPEERALYRRVARALWKAQKGSDLPADDTALEALWAHDRDAMTARARKVLNQLQRNGITVALDGDAAAD